MSYINLHSKHVLNYPVSSISIPCSKPVGYSVLYTPNLNFQLSIGRFHRDDARQMFSAWKIGLEEDTKALPAPSHNRGEGSRRTGSPATLYVSLRHCWDTERVLQYRTIRANMQVDPWQAELRQRCCRHHSTDRVSPHRDRQRLRRTQARCRLRRAERSKLAQ